MVVVCRAHHPRVPITELQHSIDTEDPGGAMQFEGTTGLQRLVPVEEPVGHFPYSAVGGGDHNYLVPGGGRPRQGAPHRDRFVVGVGVERNDRGHQLSLVAALQGTTGRAPSCRHPSTGRAS